MSRFLFGRHSSSISCTVFYIFLVPASVKYFFASIQLLRPVSQKIEQETININRTYCGWVTGRASFL